MYQTVKEVEELKIPLHMDNVLFKTVDGNMDGVIRPEYKFIEICHDWITILFRDEKEQSEINELRSKFYKNGMDMYSDADLDAGRELDIVTYNSATENVPVSIVSHDKIMFNRKYDYMKVERLINEFFDNKKIEDQKIKKQKRAKLIGKLFGYGDNGPDGI